MKHAELQARLLAAGHDERLATGALYFEAAAALAVTLDALNKIASWPEGATVRPSFDEPWSAQIARAALSKEGEHG